VRDLRVSFPTAGAERKEVLRGIDFDLAQGEVVGLLGESGCGKSTLALALLRVLPADARTVGSVTLAGTELLGLRERDMRSIRGARISIIFQEPGLALNPVLRIGTQITEILRAHTDWKRSRRDEEARALLAQAELTDVARIFDSYPHELSGGQAQRVLIAQALACAPAFVIADEPTAALDSTVQAEILALLAKLRLQRNLGILFITHNPALLLGFADRVLVMQDGRISETGAVPGIFRAPATEFTQALVAAMERRTTARGAGA
jgi:ABC-type glutathione transport system ATPase component